MALFVLSSRKTEKHNLKENTDRMNLHWKNTRRRKPTISRNILGHCRMIIVKRISRIAPVAEPLPYKTSRLSTIRYFSSLYRILLGYSPL
ncbi:hypothetical protein WAI453_002571 [Rhynchosporium graminicola]